MDPGVDDSSRNGNEGWDHFFVLFLLLLRIVRRNLPLATTTTATATDLRKESKNRRQKCLKFKIQRRSGCISKQGCCACIRVCGGCDCRRLYYCQNKEFYPFFILLSFSLSLSLSLPFSLSLAFCLCVVQKKTNCSCSLRWC